MGPLLKIAEITIDSPVILAPMAGFTDCAFRRICRRLGAGLVFTEMASTEGLRRMAPKTLHYLASAQEERPVAAHLYGGNPTALADGARVIEELDRFDLLDLNCGCPVPKIARKGSGVALIREPGKIEAILKAMRKETRLPVMVKTRTGISPGQPRIRETLRAVEDGGGAALTIHGRFARDRHGGEADWETIGEIKAIAAIPVIGNGGIKSAQEAIEKLHRYRVDGVMIGQAAIGNPWIFAEVKAILERRPFTPPTQKERFQVIAEHLRNLYRSKQAEARIRDRDPAFAGLAACREFYGHLVGYLAFTPGLGELRKIIAHTEDPEVLLAAIATVLGL